MAYNTLSPRPYRSINGVNYDLQYDRTNGKVQLIQQNAPTGTAPIYYDGRWNSSATGINSTDRQSIHNNIQTSVRSAYNSAGGASRGNTLPPWAAPSQQGQPPGQTSITPANATNQNAASPMNIGAGVGALLNPDELLSNISKNYGVGNESRLFGTIMKYPIDLKMKDQDTLVISAFEYVPPTSNSLLSGNMASIIQTGLFRGSDRLKKEVGTVFFPMPGGLSEGKDVNWGPDTLSTLNSAVLNDVMKNTEAYGVAGGLGAMLGGAGGLALKRYTGQGSVSGGAATGGSLALKGTALGRALAAATGSEDALGLLSASGVEMMSSLTGFGVPAETILSRTAGVVPNENLELLFGGPSLRSFSVSYRLTARSEIGRAHV